MTNDYLPISVLRAHYRIASRSRPDVELRLAAADLVGAITSRCTDDILGRSKCRHLSVPRYLLYWALHEVLGYNLEQTGRLLERDHSTISAGISKLAQIEQTPLWAEFILQAKRRIKHDLEAM